MDQCSQFARRLVDYRKAAELRQKEAADLAGVSVASLCHWERGISKPSVEDLEKLLVVYNARIGELYPDYVPVVPLPPLKTNNAEEIGKFREKLETFDEHLHNFIEVMCRLERACQ